MRRHAGTPVGSLVIAVILAGACTRTWELPVDQMDAAAPADLGTTDSGGAGGRGGAPGTAGHGQGGSSGVGGSIGCSVLTQEKIPVQIQTTDLIFVVGRTMSMGSKYETTTRLGAVQFVLRNLIQTYQNAVNFGYAEFPTQGSCPPNTCCVSSNTVQTLSKSWPAIDLALRQCDRGPPCLAPNDARPIAQTLMGNLWGSSQPRDPTIVLIVDGPPGCPFEDPADACQPAQDTVLNLNRAGVETLVVALGQDAQNDECLQKMAVRGGNADGLIAVSEGGSGDPMTSLSGILGQIVGQAAESSCTIELRSQPSRTDQVQVVIKGTEIPFDSSGKNGWNFQKGSKIFIQLRGSACTSLRNARPSDVSARFGCPPCGEMFPCL